LEFLELEGEEVSRRIGGRVMETVEEFLARGGQIQRVPIQPTKLEKLPHGEAQRRRLERELRDRGVKR
jgi:hypothetical protein